jgi:hypothetical protein
VLHWNPAHTFGLDADQDIDAGQILDDGQMPDADRAVDAGAEPAG